VSVVIPVWGQYERWLGEAIESLQGQEGPLEVVVVDNAADTPIDAPGGARLVRLHRRLTLGAARNAGVRAASGEYVAVWDADDLMLPGTLAALRAGLAAQPDAAAVVARILDDDGSPHRWPRAWMRRLASRRPLFLVAHCIWSLFPTTGAVLMAREMLQAGGGFHDADSGDDWVAGVSLALRGPIVHVTHPGRVYRRHRGSIWDRYASAAHLLGHARAVRARLAADAATPRWLRAGLPVLGPLQAGAVLGPHQAAVAMRRLAARVAATLRGGTRR
jgi:hypothetical protein